MRKKFASLVLLSVFTAGVAASGTVSATGGVDDVSAQVSDNVGPGGDIVDSDNSKVNDGSTENLDNNEGTANETKDLKDEEKTEEKDSDLAKEDSGNKVVYMNEEKDSDSKKFLKIAGVVGGTTSVISSTAYGAKKLFGSKNKGKSKIDDNPTNTDTDHSQPEDVKKDELSSDEESPDGGFAAWYKNNLGLSIPLTVIAAYIIWIIIRMIWLEIREIKYSKRKKLDRTKISGYVRIKPLGGLCGDIRKYPFLGNCKDGANVVGLKRVGINCLAAATFAKIEAWKPN